MGVYGSISGDGIFKLFNRAIKPLSADICNCRQKIKAIKVFLTQLRSIMLHQFIKNTELLLRKLGIQRKERLASQWVDLSCWQIRVEPIMVYEFIDRIYNKSEKMLKDYDQGYKIIIAGSSGVGKSSLLLRFVDNIFSENLLSTIGVDFKFKTLEIKGKKVKMQIWDTAGSEAFRSIVSAYYRGANAVVLVYAIDDKFSFEQISKFWITQVNKYREPDCQIMILANKSDMPIDAVTQSDLKAFMLENNISLFRQVSARTGNQVLDAFRALGEKLMSKKQIKPQDTNKVSLSQRNRNSHPDVPEGGPEKKKCC